MSRTKPPLEARFTGQNGLALQWCLDSFRNEFENGRPVFHYVFRRVRVLAVSGTWAMVRRTNSKGCAPYTCPRRQLFAVPDHENWPRDSHEPDFVKETPETT